MYAFEIRPGMIIAQGRGKKALRVLEVPFPCSPYTKIHVKVEKNTSEGKKVETYCYDRTAEVNAEIL